MGLPPVYIGFSSINSQRSEKTLAIAVKALPRAGQRGIILVDKKTLAEQCLSHLVDDEGG
ncbi:hypothetical protein [Dictyobacter formicarum]|uniref:hypothetical protein n=1 Tax=Dictyobacter formicarum TaxID=2778368 RepID=UPI001915A17F|nr:hypothetical protein [Dictyobacter formicarum]